MKKNDWFILLATASYTFLFYEQSAGFNFLLFNIVLVVLLLIRDKSLLAKPAWLAAATGSLLSAAFVFVYGTWLPIIANIISLLMLEGLSINAESSLLIAVVNSWYTILITLPFGIKRVFTESEQPNENSLLKKLPLLLIPLAISGIFFLLYREANPVFEKYTDEISLDFISFSWIVFTATGFILMAGFFYHHVIAWLYETDRVSPDNLKVITLEDHMHANQLFSFTNEMLSGIILFVLLNLLLLSVNILDVYTCITQKLPEGVKLAQYLHDGTNTLILSICLAIAIILVVFRGYLNFFEKNRLLKALAFGWIIQNAVLIITTAQRNWWVIESSGLTRRRIGIYVYLTLCLIGLATTLVKVARKKSNWFLFRKNSWAFYGVLIACCFVDWDDFIVQYNCSHFKALDFGYIDRNYQADLGHTSLASLFEYYKQERKEAQTQNKIFNMVIVSNMFNRYDALKKETAEASWKSYCLSKTSNVKAIDEMIAKGETPKP